MHEINQVDENRIGANSEENKVIESVRRVVKVANLGEVEVNQDRL